MKLLYILSIAFLFSCASKQVDEYTIDTGEHLNHDIATFDTEGNVQVVIEIPAGTNQKWEVDEETGLLKWEFKKGKPRVVKYLPYPFNYGMIPRTLQSEKSGGDGDPLDIAVLGPGLPRGEVVSVKVIGGLHFTDDGERDDKLIAVQTKGPLSHVNSLSQLNREFPGVLTIIVTWFDRYKGPGEMEYMGKIRKSEVMKTIRKTSKAYKKTYQK